MYRKRKWHLTCEWYGGRDHVNKSIAIIFNDLLIESAV